ncbi:MAG TPA: HNH endonuclease [Blastocatellia bacterium]|nr:HNH endonuclease [Blastocatellia bacterium]
MKYIFITGGQKAKVDDADHTWLSKYTWHLKKDRNNSYTATNILFGKRYKTVYMHALIMSPPAGMQVDHRNGDGLDNQRKNLRVCTQLQNSYNRKKYENCSSQFKGVTWAANIRKWRVWITKNQRRIYLGNFINEREAALTYDREAMNLFGEFARLNFPYIAKENGEGT